MRSSWCILRFFARGSLFGNALEDAGVSRDLANMARRALGGAFSGHRALTIGVSTFATRDRRTSLFRNNTLGSLAVGGPLTKVATGGDGGGAGSSPKVSPRARERMMPAAAPKLGQVGRGMSFLGGIKGSL